MPCFDISYIPQGLIQTIWLYHEFVLYNDDDNSNNSNNK